MADRKRKLEQEDSDVEKSPKRRKSYSVEMKLKIISEASDHCPKVKFVIL